METYYIIGIFSLVCIVWVIYDVYMRNKKMNPFQKVSWTIGAILFGSVGALFYYLFWKRKK